MSFGITRRFKGSDMKSVTLPKSTTAVRKALSVLLALAGSLIFFGAAHAAPTKAPVVGEIEGFTIDTPTDHWSGGTVVVGSKIIILPRNLLLDLPANRLTLWQLYDQAPPACKALGETGLAKSDKCNHSGFGGIASIAANKTNGGNVIAGDVLLVKGEEAVIGRVTYINYTDGYLRVNGVVGDATKGLMARMNDPTSRHTVQQGLGCSVDSLLVNCSADPRFALDADNYVNVSTTGFPMCLPSTVSRTWAGLPSQSTGANNSPAVAGGSTASDANGVGDALCPSTNRVATDLAADSRRFAPIKVGDDIELEGNFEDVDGVHFLSFHTSKTMVALGTKTALSQPDYLLPEEVFVEAPAFQNSRARTLIIGFSTLRPDILVNSIHYDPQTNTKHEKPLASTAGCDAVAGAGQCAGTGILGAPNQGAAGANIFRIRYDVDFVIGADARLDPCSQLRADPRMWLKAANGTPMQPCPGWGLTGKASLYNAQAIGESFAVLSPIMHEVQMRTGHLLAANAAGITPTTVDVMGRAATNGQYLYPFGINLGGIEVADFLEINIALLQAPYPFSGIPWNLDRRLSPNGCLDGVCEPTPQPLEPFPFEDQDPRTQTLALAAGGVGPGALPNVLYADPTFTASALSTVRNRVLSYVTRLPDTLPERFDFNGNSSVLAWPPTDPVAQAIVATPALTFCASNTLGGCTVNSGVLFSAPTAVASVASPVSLSAVGTAHTVNAGTQVTLSAAGSVDTNDPVLPLSYAWSQVSGPAVALTGAATDAPTFIAPIAATDSVLVFSLTVSNGQANATAEVTVNVNQVSAPTAVATTSTATVNAGSAISLSAAGSVDTNSPAVLGLTYLWTKLSPASPAVTITNATRATPTITAPGVATATVYTFQVAVSNGYKTSTATVTVTVNPSPPTVTVTNATVNGRSFSTVSATATGTPGTTLSYSWVKLSGTAVTFTGGTTRTISFTAPGVPGPLVFTVTVTDNLGLSASANVTITVVADALRAQAFYYTGQKKVTVWMNSNATALASLTASFQDGDKTWTQTKTEGLNFSGLLGASSNCNTGLSSPNVTKCAIVLLVGTSAVPTAGTGTAAAPVGTWVSITSPGGGGAISVPMVIKP